MPICLYEKAVSRRIPAGSTRHIGVGTVEARGFPCVLFCTLWILNDTNVLSFKIHSDLKEGNENNPYVETWRDRQDHD